MCTFLNKHTDKIPPIFPSWAEVQTVAHQVVCDLVIAVLVEHYRGHQCPLLLPTLKWGHWSPKKEGFDPKTPLPPQNPIWEQDPKEKGLTQTLPVGERAEVGTQISHSGRGHLHCVRPAAAAALTLKTGTPFYFKGKMLAVMPGWL